MFFSGQKGAKMEHDFDLHVPKAETKNRSGKINCKYLRRFIAILLSVVLTAGACLPAIAAEQQETQNEDAGGNLLNAQGDASWLDDYTYYTTDLDEWTTAICLEHYNGTDTEIEVRDPKCHIFGDSKRWRRLG